MLTSLISIRPILRILFHSPELTNLTFDHPQMSFLDTFQGNHQISLAKNWVPYADREISLSSNAIWLKEHWDYLTRMFEAQLGKNVEAYRDDMVVKNKQVFQLLRDLNEVFSILRKHSLPLNASRCSFSVRSGKVLGYMITHRGIEVNPD